MFDVRRQILKVAAHDPENERQADQLIDPDQANVGIGEAERLEIERQRQEDQQGRGKSERQKGECNVFAEAEPEAGKCVGRRNAEDQRHHN